MTETGDSEEGGSRQARVAQAEAILAEVLRHADSGEAVSLEELVSKHPSLELELRAGYSDWLDFGRRLRADDDAGSNFNLDLGLRDEIEFELPLHRTSHLGPDPRELPSPGRSRRKLASSVGLVVIVVFWLLQVFGPGQVTYELKAAHGGAQIDADPLFMGPGRKSVALTFIGSEDAELVGSALRVISERDGREIAGFQAEWTRANGIRFWSDEVGNYRRERVRLEPVEGNALFKPFTLVVLGEDAWRVGALGFDESRVKWSRDATDSSVRIPVDPENTDISAWVVGEGQADVERITVRASYGAPRRMTVRASEPETTRFAHSLAGLELKPGPTELTFSLRDSANRVQEVTLPIEVVVDPLLVDIVGIFQTAEDGEWTASPRSTDGVVLAPEDAPVFRLETRRPSDLSWQLFVGDEEAPRVEETSSGLRIHEVALFEALQALGTEVVRGRIDYTVNEDEYVIRAADSERGRRTASIAFLRSAGKAEFTSYLATATGRQALVPGAPAFTTGESARLELEGHVEVPARFFTFIDDPSGQRIPVEPKKATPGQRIEIPLPFREPGTYRVGIQSFQLDPDSSEPVDRPDEVQEYSIVVDRSAPELSLGGEHAAWTSALGDSPFELAASLQYTGATDARVLSIDCRLYEVERPGDADAPVTERAESTERRRWSIEGTSPFTIEIARDSVERDGLYALQVGGRDLAGNSLAVAEVLFEVARDGPTIELVRPTQIISASASSDGAVWRPSSGDEWTIQVRIDDPNEVALAECLLRAGDRELGISLTRAEDLFTGRVELDSSWSKTLATLRVSALDQFANESVLELADLMISEIRGPVYRRVQLDFGDTPVNSMRRVAGNVDFSYVFGGRGDAIENELFERAGLAPLNRALDRGRAQSFVRELAPGSIGDFYLDEAEVSNEEYLAFVMAPNGFANRANWPENARVPSPSRTAELLVRLRDARGDYPVHGVNLDEARAYAAWVGKRLPTWREWEIAVRGGELYRPTASWNGEAGGVRVKADRNLRARGAGSDRTADTELVDLCSNLAEWTTTACPFDPGAFWIAGGSYITPTHDFAVVDDRPREWSGPTVGFRCAQAAHVVEARVHRMATPGQPMWIADEADEMGIDQ